MTQAQLRAFIPLMLKYSTGRGKPGWGRDSTRPPWWPKELPWANVRMDARSAFSEEDDKSNVLIQQSTPHSSSHPSHSSSQGQGGQSQQQQQTVGVVRLSSTDSSKGNSSPAQIIAASPTALATATQVGVDRVQKKKKKID